MAKGQFIIGAEFELASPKDVSDANDRLFDRLTGSRRRGVYRRIPGSAQLPAATYANGVSLIINFGPPSDGKLWLINAVTVTAVNDSTTPPTWAVPSPFVSNLMVGSAPKQMTAATVFPAPPVTDLVDSNTSAATTFHDANYSQPYPVRENEDAYVYAVAVGNTVIAQTLLFVATLHVWEVDSVNVLVGGL